MAETAPASGTTPASARGTAGIASPHRLGLASTRTRGRAGEVAMDASAARSRGAELADGDLSSFLHGHRGKEMSKWSWGAKFGARGLLIKAGRRGLAIVRADALGHALARPCPELWGVRRCFYLVC